MVKVPPPPVTASWQKSNASLPSTSDCAEIVRIQEHVWVRDSKNPLGPVLGLTCAGWAAFVAGVQRDEFDCSGVLA